MALFNKGDIVVDLKTGAQFDVAETGELDETKYGRMEPGTKATPQEILSAKPQQTTPTAPTPDDLKHKPRFPKLESAARTLAGPVATGVAGLATGGWSLPAQAAIGAGTELAGQKLAGEEIDPLAIGISAALPGVVRAAGGAFKTLARGTAKVVGKQNLVEGGIQKAEKVLGKPAAEAESAASLTAAKAVTTPVTQTETGKVVSELLSKKGRVAGIDPQTIATTEELVRNAANAAKAGDPIRYNELFETATNMNKLASKAKGHDKEAFLNLRKAMLSDLAAVSPEAGKAVKAYHTKASIDDVAEAMRGANPTKKVADILADPLLKGVFDKTQEHTINTIARHIGSAGLFKLTGSLASIGLLGYTHPGGAAAAALGPAVIGALVAAPKIGPVMARSLVGPEGTINKAAIPALAQMVRGYLATPEEE